MVRSSCDTVYKSHLCCFHSLHISLVCGSGFVTVTTAFEVTVLRRNFDIYTYVFHWNVGPNCEWQFWGLVYRDIFPWISSLYSRNSTGCDIDASNLMNTSLGIVILYRLILEKQSKNQILYSKFNIRADCLIVLTAGQMPIEVENKLFSKTNRNQLTN